MRDKRVLRGSEYVSNHFFGYGSCRKMDMSENKRRIEGKINRMYEVFMKKH